MSLVAVKSGAIAALQYNKKEKTLDVHFTNNDVRTYKNVPEDVYEEFIHAQSVGYYFNMYVRDKYGIEEKVQ